MLIRWFLQLKNENNFKLSYTSHTMKKSVLSIWLCALMFSIVPFEILLAQRDIEVALMRDIVKVENGTYSIGEYGLLSSFDKEYEIKITATAPVTLLSRDNFIRFYGAFSSSIFSTYLHQEGIKAPDDLQIVLKDKPGDPIDITVTLSMNEEGVYYTVATESSTSKMTIQWRNQLYTDVK